MGRKTSLHRRGKRCTPHAQVSVGNFHLIAADRTEFPVGSGKPGYESAGSVGKVALGKKSISDRGPLMFFLLPTQPCVDLA
ncbi:hypothetical protein CDAR_441131 [Caerostris darwini]|uniref:Ribosomal protein L2 n=1 Tax=Caerostris darwini TaxID=1538125 RepID=A0AAV4Q3F5_9ARAC|nr:hypothetical protein CDAR_441131 [Caerostris darwini]